MSALQVVWAALVAAAAVGLAVRGVRAVARFAIGVCFSWITRNL